MGLLDSLMQMFASLTGGGNQRHYHDLLGLSPEEDFKAAYGCTMWQQPSKADDAKAAALQLVGVFTGHIVAQTGVQAMVGITTTDRLVIGQIAGHSGPPLSFDAGSGHQLVDTGQHTKEKVMGPTGRREPGCILSLAGPDGELFQLFIAESKAKDFIGWG